MPQAIEFREVCYAAQDGRLLLNHVSMHLEEGTTTAILGRSGSGKTTLLRTVNRMIELTSGRVLVQGNDIAAADLISLRRGIGYVIQETGLFPHFTVERNAGLALEIQGLPPAQCNQCSRLWLASVGLDPDAYGARYPHQLSGGQRQRVGLARALAADPPILLMDEPFGALDPLTRAEMQDMLQTLLARLRSEGKAKTVLLVTHDLDEALYLADTIVLLGEGKLIVSLTPTDFLKSTEPAVQSYIQAFHRGEKNTANSLTR